MNCEIVTAVAWPTATVVIAVLVFVAWMVMWFGCKGDR